MEPALSNRFFRRAFKIATSHLQSPEVLVSYHAALIVRGGNVISAGVNTNKRHMFVKLHNFEEHNGIHAECAAILAARKKVDLTGCTAYVLRVLRDGRSIAMSRPCEKCEVVLRDFGIKKVYYTQDGGGFDVLKF